MTELSDILRQRIDYRRGPRGELIAILTLTTPYGMRRVQSVLSRDEVARLNVAELKARGRLSDEVGAIAPTSPREVALSFWVHNARRSPSAPIAEVDRWWQSLGATKRQDYRASYNAMRGEVGDTAGRGHAWWESIGANRRQAMRKKYGLTSAWDDFGKGVLTAVKTGLPVAATIFPALAPLAIGVNVGLAAAKVAAGGALKDALPAISAIAPGAVGAVAKATLGAQQAMTLATAAESLGRMPMAKQITAGAARAAMQAMPPAGVAAFLREQKARMDTATRIPVPRMQQQQQQQQPRSPVASRKNFLRQAEQRWAAMSPAMQARY